MTPAQIKKAQELLAKRAELLRLVDRHNNVRGQITKLHSLTDVGMPALDIQSDGFKLTVGIDTLERWIKQAKKAKKMGILD